MPLFTLSEGFLGTTPLFVVWLGLLALAIILFLLAQLLRSYALVFLALIGVIVTSVLAFMNQYLLMGVVWILFILIACIMSALHLYKNVRGAAWWSIGSVIGLFVSAFTCSEKISLEDEGALANIGKSLLIPFLIFFVIGLLGSIIYPRIMFRHKKDERKHKTNTDPIIGRLIAVTKNPSGEFPARGILGDVDWSIKPFFPHEKFKVGDIVKVNKIEGVTLICTRNGKDLRDEIRDERAREAEQRRLEREEARLDRKAEKQARIDAKNKLEQQRKEEKLAHKAELEAERDELRREKQQFEKDLIHAKAESKIAIIQEKVARKAVTQRKTKKINALAFVTAFIFIVLAFIVGFASYKIPGFYPPGTIICVVIFILYFVFLLIFLIMKKRNGNVEVKPVEEKVEEPVEEPVVTVVKEEPKPAKPVKAPAPVVVPAPAAKAEKAEFIPFTTRMKKADKMVKDAYNELKSEVLSYGIKSRVSTTGDTFRLHTKEYCKMVIAGKSLKLYLALNPKDYKNTTYPFDDASKMSAHKETPFVFKIKSSLSIRRAKVLIGDAAKKDGLTQGEVVAHNHVKDLM